MLPPVLAALEGAWPSFSGFPANHHGCILYYFFISIFHLFFFHPHMPARHFSLPGISIKDKKLHKLPQYRFTVVYGHSPAIYQRTHSENGEDC